MQSNFDKKTLAPTTWLYRAMQRIIKINFALAIGLTISIVIAMLLTRYDLVQKLTGFASLMLFANIAMVLVIAILLALIVRYVADVSGAHKLILWRGWVFNGWGLNGWGLIAQWGIYALLVGYIVAIKVWMAPVAQVPLLHDISTDVINPPTFRVLSLREDNLRGVNTMANWREVHRAGYPDIVTIKSLKSKETVIAEIEKLGAMRGWQMVIVDPVNGHVEATETVSWLRFYDDIVLRVRSVGDGSDGEDGTGSIIDMRSISRVGTSDLGINAKRIHAFLQALANHK